MRPAGEIERLLDRLEDQTSAAFDELTVRDMFGALDEAIRTVPARSWRDIARVIVSSRIGKLAAAAVLVIAVLLLARLLIGRDTMVTPRHEDRTIAGGEGGPGLTATVREDLQLRLAQENEAAEELFAKADTQGLLRLLDAGLDQTKVTVASYLGRIGDEAALPALQNLADQWRGAVEENPFRKSIEQIRNAVRRRDEAAPESQPVPRAQPVSMAVEPNGPHIVVHVTDKETGEPIPQAAIQVRLDSESRDKVADDRGALIVDLSESLPGYFRISVPQEGYVWQAVTLRNLKREKLPKTILFSLERAIAIGAVVHDSDGRPIEGVSVSSSISEEQQFDQPCVSVRLEAKTDAEGRWRWANVPRDVARIWFNVRHPDFADGGFEMPGDLKFEDLKAERAVMVLDKGIAITGRVTDMTGKPIVGAKLLAGEDYFARDWTETDAAGHFEFLHLRPLNQSFLLTVQAPGFTPQRKDLPSEKGLAPVDFVLEPAKLLIGRVVDPAGKPVEGAYVYSEDWRDYRTVKWEAKTDARGMFVWNYPPDDAITIRIGKSGYREFEREVVANDREQTFVLARPVTIKGSVTDGETGRPISRFKVTPGAHWRGGTKATWQDSESWVKWSTDGRYSYAFSGDATAYAVRIEADGYPPAESRFVDANELEVTIDIALTKGQGPSGSVFDANATPVEGAEVFWERIIHIENGQMLNRTRLACVKTDAEGRFVFRPDNRKDSFVAISDRGIGFASYEDLVRDGSIMLTPWARVQGDLHIGTRPATNKVLQLMGQGRPALEGMSPISAEATTDESGRFVFERVYPGEFRLYNQSYQVAPGQTLELHLGGTGRTLRGELAIPGASDVPIWANLELVTLRAPVPFDKWPKPPAYDQMTLAEVEVWLERFARSAEGEAYAIWLAETYPQMTQSLRVEMDDRSTFHVDNVEPGVYVLKGTIYPSPVHGHSWMNEVVGRVWHQVEVPPFASSKDLDAPLDLGTVAVLQGELKAGDPAPAFDVPACGPGSIRLTDYRGKVLLVTFCASSIADLNLAAMHDLKGVYQRFHEDPHYAQVSLLFADNPVLTRKIVDGSGLDWRVGLMEWQGKVVEDYGIKTVPWNVLIGSQGEIIAVGVSGEALWQAIEKALSALQ